MVQLADMAVAGNGQTIALAHWTRTVTLRRGGLRSPAHHLIHSEPANRVELSTNGRVLATSGRHGLALWDVERGELLHQLHSVQNWANPGFSPDGRRLAHWSKDRPFRVALWDVATGSEIERLPIAGGTEHTFSPDGTWLAVGHQRGTIQLLNLQSREVTSFTNHTGLVRAIAFSPQGDLMVSGAHSREVSVWNIAEARSVGVLRGPKQLVAAMAYAPGGDVFASGSKDGTIRFWSPDVVPTSVSEEMKLSESSIQAGILTADGGHLVTLHTNGVARIVELTTMKELARVSLGVDARLLALSNGGRWLAWRDAELKVMLWDANRPTEPPPGTERT